MGETRWGRYVSEVEQRFILRADALLNPKGTFLEVGCDGGRWSKLLVDRGWRAVCTDVNPEGLALCQQRIPSAQCILVKPDASSLPCPTGSANLLLCIEVVPVILAEWFMGEAARVLQGGGYLVGVFNNKRSLRGAVGHWANRRASRFDWYARSYPAWKAEMLAAGFRMVEETGLCWFPFSRKSDHPLVPFFVRLEVFLGLRRLPNLSPWVVFLAQKTD